MLCVTLLALWGFPCIQIWRFSLSGFDIKHHQHHQIYINVFQKRRGRDAIDEKSSIGICTIYRCLDLASNVFTASKSKHLDLNYKVKTNCVCVDGRRDVMSMYLDLTLRNILNITFDTIRHITYSRYPGYSYMVLTAVTLTIIVESNVIHMSTQYQRSP